MEQSSTDVRRGPVSSDRDDALVVLYDGACPLCRREIAHYQRLEALAPVRFEDVSDPVGVLPTGLCRSDALARFHVRDEDGTLLSGARAFVALWGRLPGWRWLARLARLPGVTGLLEVAYRAFLPVRPLLQRWARSFRGR